AVATAPFEAPCEGLEETIAALLRDVLRVDRIGIHDNFFDAGAHSLSIVQVQQKLRAILGREIPVVALFQYPTIAALAAHLTPGYPVAGPGGVSGGGSVREGATRVRYATRRGSGTLETQGARV